MKVGENRSKLRENYEKVLENTENKFWEKLKINCSVFVHDNDIKC